MSHKCCIRAALQDKMWATQNLLQQMVEKHYSDNRLHALCIPNVKKHYSNVHIVSI